MHPVHVGRGESESYLQEADSHEEEAVGADSPGENLIEIPLQQELLQHQHQVRQHRVFLKDTDAARTW